MFFQPQHHSVVQTDAECIFNIEQKFVRINRFIYFQLLVILLRCYQDRTTISPKKFLHLYPFLLERGLFWIFFFKYCEFVKLQHIPNLRVAR